jgi:prepilin-type N-terminal cleavage/methylation domain-containing protein
VLHINLNTKEGKIMIKREAGAVILGEKTGDCLGANAPRNDSVRKTFCHCEPKAKQSQAVACLPRIGEAGFSLVELMITMVVFVFVIAAASGVFTGLLTQFKQQSKIAETNIEGIVGLEILRRDIESAGYGLPWNLGGASYNEAVVESATPWIDRDFNDGPPDNPARGTDPVGASNPPAGIRSGNSVALNVSDVLVIKAINVAISDACKKWTTLGAASPYVRTWTPANENLAGTNRVIVLSPGTTDENARTLIVSGTTFSTTYSGVTSTPWRPTDPTETRIVYGVDPDTNLRMPFNRADYYVRIPATNMPQRCAPNTGILYKGTVNQGDGKLSELPLLDCVADMQAVYALDNDENGDFVDGTGTPADAYSDDISTLTAQQIRKRVKEVRVYILAQEGQRDANYTYPNSTLTIPASPDPATGLGSTFNLATRIGNPEYKYYRWKLYTIVVTPTNLR